MGIHKVVRCASLLRLMVGTVIIWLTHRSCVGIIVYTITSNKVLCFDFWLDFGQFQITWHCLHLNGHCQLKQTDKKYSLITRIRCTFVYFPKYKGIFAHCLLTKSKSRTVTAQVRSCWWSVQVALELRSHASDFGTHALAELKQQQQLAVMPLCVRAACGGATPVWRAPGFAHVVRCARAWQRSAHQSLRCRYYTFRRRCRQIRGATMYCAM